MVRFFKAGAVVASMSLFVALSGCGGSSDSQTGASEPAEAGGAAPVMAGDSHAGHDHAEHAEQGGGDAMQKMQEGLAGLSEADRQAAMKQHVCPVSGEMLGAMGTPVKVTVRGRDVWLCCSNCEKALAADPDKYLAKLNP